MLEWLRRRLVLRLLLVLAGAVVLGLAGAGEAFAWQKPPPQVNGHPFASEPSGITGGAYDAKYYFMTNGGKSGWAQRPVYVIKGSGTRQFVVHLTEPYYNEATQRFEGNGSYRMRTGQSGGSGSAFTISYYFECLSVAGVVGEQLSSSQTRAWNNAVGGPFNDGTVYFSGSNGTGDCGTGSRLIGFRVEIDTGEVVHKNWWTPPQWGDVQKPGWHECRDLFGWPWFPDTHVIIGGEPVTPEQYGCDPNAGAPGDSDWAADFNAVCANPPELEYFEILGVSVAPTPGSIADWIGHYAYCLFVPQGGWNTAAVDAAIQAGPFGPLGTAVAGVSGALSTTEDCGVILDASGTGVPMVLDTCAMAGGPVPWSTARTLIGVAALLWATWAGVVLLVRAVTGLNVGSESGDDS